MDNENDQAQPAQTETHVEETRTEETVTEAPQSSDRPEGEVSSTGVTSAPDEIQEQNDRQDDAAQVAQEQPAPQQTDAS